MVDTSKLPWQGPGAVRWVTTDYSPGDVLVFNSHTVHMALSNESDQARISLDCRAQPLSEPVSTRALQPNWPRQTWDEIYSSPEFQVGPSPCSPLGGSNSSESLCGKDDESEVDVRYYWRRQGPLRVVDGFDANAFQSTFDPMEY